MNKIDKFTIELTEASDLRYLLASPKNRSSFYKKDDGVKADNHQFAADLGMKRVKKWMKNFRNSNFSPLATLPVWDNGDGTYTLGDGHTRIEALRAMYDNKDIKDIPAITLTIRNYKFSNVEEFINETKKLNVFPGFKWDAWDKIDALRKDGVEQALSLEEKYDKAASMCPPHKIPLNMILNIYLDTQGTTKVGMIENTVPKVSEFNPYGDSFLDFFREISNAVDAFAKKTGDKVVNIWNENFLQAIYNIYMCAIHADEQHNNKAATDAFAYILTKFFATKTGDAFNKVNNLTNSTAITQVLQFYMNKISGSGTQKDLTHKDGLKNLSQVFNSVLSGPGCLKQIEGRGGRRITFLKGETVNNEK